MFKRTEESVFGKGNGPSMMEGLIETFSSTTNKVAQPQPVEPLTGNFNNQNAAQKPNADATPDMNVIQEALETKAPLVVEKNKTFTANANPETIRDDINDAGAKVEAAKTELAKLDQPGGLKQSFTPASSGTNAQPASMSRELGGALVFNAATGGISNAAIAAMGMNTPLITGAFALKTVVDVASIIGRGSHGDTTPSAFTTQSRRGKNSERQSGYADATPSTPATPVMNRFAEMMGRMPGITASFSRRDIEDTGTTVRMQEIKLGETPLEKMRASLDRLERRVELADTALNVRAEKGATVSVAEAVQAASERDMKSGFKVASFDKPVQIYGNLA